MKGHSRVSIVLAAIAAGAGGLLPGSAADSPPAMLVGREIIQAFGACKCSSGEVLLTEPKLMAVIGLDPQTGYFRMVSKGGLLGVPAGIANEPSGTVLVANGHALIRVDPRTGAQGCAYSGRFFSSPVGVAVAGDGLIYVSDAAGLVIRVDPGSGWQTIISNGGVLTRPQGIVLRGNDIYVTDVAGRTGNAGVGRIVQIDMLTGRQRIVAQGGYLVGPVSLAVEASGQLLVGDPYAIEGPAPDQMEPGIIRIDPETGAQTYAGKGALVPGGSYSGTPMAVHFQILQSTFVSPGIGAPAFAGRQSGNGIRGLVNPLAAGGPRKATASARP
jgi:hypothetical protein